MLSTLSRMASARLYSTARRRRYASRSRLAIHALYPSRLSKKSIKGAKDSFVETLRTNTALVRKRICSPKLKVIESSIGRKSHTKLAIMFVDGVASPDTVRELASRLDALDVDALLATGTLEEYIVDAPRSPFPQLLHTERPDRFSMYLMDGRVGILIDGLPIGLVLPVTLAEFMKSDGRCEQQHLVATVLTVLRYFALFSQYFSPGALCRDRDVPPGDDPDAAAAVDH